MKGPGIHRSGRPVTFYSQDHGVGTVRESLDKVVFIMGGCLEILEDDDVVVAILSNGDAFGEEVWKQKEGKKFKKQKSRYYVRALAPTDLRILKSESLAKVLMFYHHFGQSFDAKMKLR